MPKATKADAQGSRDRQRTRCEGGDDRGRRSVVRATLETSAICWEADSSAGHLAQLCIIGSSFSYGDVPASALLLNLRKDSGTLQSALWLIKYLITRMSWSVGT